MASKHKRMIEDDLEYHINFPIPESYEPSNLDLKFDSKEYESTDDDGLSRKSNAQEAVNTNLSEKCIPKINIETQRLNIEPVVFLLGWFSAQDRHLAKYSSLYNKLGCITVRYTAPSKDIFGVNHSNLKVIAKKLLKLLEDTTLSQHPVIFHNFSNHGSTLYSYISQQMEVSEETPLEVVGCIFDSTPSPFRIQSGKEGSPVRRCIHASGGLHALSQGWEVRAEAEAGAQMIICTGAKMIICTGAGAIKSLVLKAVYRTTEGSYRAFTFAVLCIGLFFWKALGILSSLITGHLPFSPPWCLLQESSRWPQLFLYSKVDDLVPFEDVQLFASERLSLGVPVVTHEFLDSPHVTHYKVHPQEYRRVVNDFLKRCLKDYYAAQGATKSSDL